MALAESEPRQRAVLPPIKHLELDKLKTDHLDHHRYNMIGALTSSSAPLGSPTTIYSGPPPPYSSASSTATSVPGTCGYISPPTSTRRSTLRDEKDSPTGRQSLPSISEALGDKNMSYPSTASGMAPSPLSASQPHQPAHPTPNGQVFPDAPRGPSNPFSQPAAPASITREAPYTTQPPPRSSFPAPDPQRPTASFAAINATEPRPSASQPSFHQSPRIPPSYNHGYDVNGPGPLRSPHPYNAPRSTFNFSNQPPNPPPPTSFPQQTQLYQFGQRPPDEDRRSSFQRPPPIQPYEEHVKRHLDVYDTEISLNEISEASGRTFDFSRVWLERSNSANRNGYFPEVLPGLTEVEEMMRQSTRVMEALSRIREVIAAQQTALSEQRIRAARQTHPDEEYATVQDDFKAGGFAGGDAKKRRGKAAPPGRCHSCNRAETPEWRRGPDGARTLCNACGLHYAKLTRKLGANKSAAVGGSNLRPKPHDSHP